MEATKEKKCPSFHVPSPEDFPEIEEYAYKVISAYSKMNVEFHEALVDMWGVSECAPDELEPYQRIIKRFLSRFIVEK